MTINEALTALVADLLAGDVPDPIAQEFTLANIWYDLCRLAGEPVPPLVAALVDPQAAVALPEVSQPAHCFSATHAPQLRARSLGAD